MKHTFEGVVTHTAQLTREELEGLFRDFLRTTLSRAKCSSDAKIRMSLKANGDFPVEEVFLQWTE